jgi:hypothetical protein
MARRIRIGVLAIASLGVLAVPGSVLGAYSTPVLEVTQLGARTTISLTQARTDDATARASVYVPAGTTSTLSQPPGTTLGPATAQVTARLLDDAPLPFTGEIAVAPPGTVAAASQQACIEAETPVATWLMTLRAVGQTLTVPVYILTTSGTDAAIGPARIVVCLPPPDLPVAGGGNILGLRWFSVTFSVNGVLNAPSAGAWLAVWTPYTAPAGPLNAAASVATPATFAPGSLTVRVARSGPVATRVSGAIAQGGRGFGGATIQLWAGATKSALKQVATASTAADGSYAFTYRRTAGFFRTRTVVPGRTDPALCPLFADRLQTPCANPTVNGFAAVSPIARRP